MKHWIKLSTAFAAAGVISATAAAVALAGGTAATRGATVKIASSSLGRILVDPRGRTLYLFESDRNGVSACNTACQSYWPPFTSRTVPRAGAGVQQSLLRLAKPQHGVRQVTYAGHPLYTFVGDKRPGQTTGEGLNNFGGGWDALGADGRKIEKSHSTGSGYGYSSGGGY
jgi:predicted lipoprotein with Yx(FWY)xxD motif